MRVIRNKDNIQAIWKSIKATGGLGKSLEMFKEVNENPMENIETFLELADALCGKKAYPYGDDVSQMLKDKKVNKNKHCLLAELFGWCAEKLRRLENQVLQFSEVQAYSAAVILFAKILKQVPMDYYSLNKFYLDVSDQQRQGM